MFLGFILMLLKFILIIYNFKVLIFFEFNDKYELYSFYLNGNFLNDVLEEIFIGENVF